jgi:hypothetical protein
MVRNDAGDTVVVFLFIGFGCEPMTYSHGLPLG